MIDEFRVRQAGYEPELASRLAELLIDCVDGGASVSFMAPLARDKAMQFWEHVIDSVGRAERVLLVAETSTRRLLGSVQVVFDLPENQPHRGDIAKMLVYREARRQGVGAALLGAAEVAARAAGRSLLVLDTVVGGAGERLYARSGWHRVGVIPGYALLPYGEVCDTAYFYKAIDAASPASAAALVGM